MKIICVGRNYAAHAKEMNSEVPDEPMLFIKPESALCKSEKIPYPGFTREFHYELEVVLFVNKEGKNIPVENAGSYFDSIGLGIDFTARDIQAKCKELGHPWERAKAFDNSAVVSAPVKKNSFSEAPITFTLKKNGKTVQEGNTKQLIFSFEYLIHNISEYFTLRSGDLVFTGTPAGVGAVEPGDRLEAFLGDELLLNLSIIRE